MKSYPVVDIFCGVGGLAHGFFKEGFNVIAGIDSDPFCKYAYERNNRARFIEADVSSMEGENIVELYPEGNIRILVGCAPCQPFSSYTNKIRQKDHGQWTLLRSFGRLIEHAQPEIVSMENVPSLGSKPIFKEFVHTLSVNDYCVVWSNVFCPDYGVPQRRTRLVLFASKLGEVRMVDPSHSLSNYVTVREVIGDLPTIGVGDTYVGDPLHRSSMMSDLNLRRIKSSLPGGTWEDWEEDLLAECHKKASGRSYYNVYGRMEWDRISPTITTQFLGFGNGRFGHPEQDRALSLREGALLQTFPPEYEFVEPDSDYYITHVAKHIGNAVPVKLGMAIARSIRRHLEANGA